MARGCRVGCLNELAAELLGPDEAAYFSRLHFERRQESYLLGRYAAKLALGEAISEADLKSIQIVKGLFEQPIVQCERNAGWAVTISHSESLTVGLAYPTGHPMGIDVEQIDETRLETVLSQLSREEICWVQKAAAHRHKVATAVWSMKEALSKALTTGLMTPVQIYGLAELASIDSGQWEGQFRNFAQYKARVWSGTSHVMSIAMPKRSIIDAQGDLCALL
jgi:phosphopantetheinyl transferase